MANIQTELKNWSITEASNQPDSTDPTTLAGDLRAIQSGIRYYFSQDTIASAGTTDIGSKAAGRLSITGTTTITALGTVSAGIKKTCVFAGALTLTHNATSLILPGAANITTAANDRAEFESLGSGNWICNWYVKASGQPITSPLSDGDKGDITVTASGATWTIDDDVIDAATLGDSSFGVSMINGTLTASVAASALTIAIKTKAGTDPSASDPVLIYFRNVNAGTGDYTVISLTAATSFVVSSGSTLGTTSAVLSRLWIVGFNDGGTFRLGVANITTSLSIGDDVIASSTAEGGAGGADSANTFYTGTAVTSKAMRVLGYVESTQATAGTWATSPSKLQMVSNINDTKAPATSSNLISGTVTATTSGTSIDFTNIPSWAKRISIMFSGVSTNGTSNPMIQIGDSGGIEATGYLSSAAISTTSGLFTTGFGLGAATAAASAFNGIALLVLMDSSTNTWALSSNIGYSNAAGVAIAGGSKALSAALDRLRLTTVSGADTFDAGSMNITYE